MIVGFHSSTQPTGRTGAYLNRAILSNTDIVGAKFIDVKMKDTIGHFGRETGAFFGKAVELADGSFEIRGKYSESFSCRLG
jgi:hypothetical protein